MKSTAVITFGRMQPPTLGHAKLIDYLIARAQKVTGTVIVFPSATQDTGTNPLSRAEKVALLRKSFPGITIGPTTANTPSTAITWAAEAGYRNIILAVGSDRVSDFERLAENWNDWNARNDNLPATVTVESVPRFQRISATTARKLAMANDFEGFKSISLPRIPNLMLKQTIQTIQGRLREMTEYTEFELIIEADESKPKNVTDAKSEIATLKGRLASLEKVVKDSGTDGSDIEVDIADDTPTTSSKEDSSNKSFPPKKDAPAGKENSDSKKSTAPPKKDSPEGKSESPFPPKKKAGKKPKSGKPSPFTKKPGAKDESGKKSTTAKAQPKKSGPEETNDNSDTNPAKGAPVAKPEPPEKSDGAEKRPEDIIHTGSPEKDTADDDEVEVDAPEDSTDDKTPSKKGSDQKSEEDEEDSKDSGGDGKPPKGSPDKSKKGDPVGKDDSDDQGDIEVDAPDDDGEGEDGEDPPDPADRVTSDRPDNKSKLALHPPQRLLFRMGQKMQDDATAESGADTQFKNAKYHAKDDEGDGDERSNNNTTQDRNPKKELGRANRGHKGKTGAVSNGK